MRSGIERARHPVFPGTVAMMTVGHSNRTIGEFLEILAAHRVELLVDVRTVPRSRKNPQFNREILPETLQGAGIAYMHLGALGGLRKARKDSPNTAWQNLSFRGYADYMLTPEFDRGLADLLDRSAGLRTAIMCAESVPWRCHRSLIADALTARGIRVVHLMSAKQATEHRLTPFAKVEGDRVTYPGLLDQL
jgi:uncharacterized protein (DUF488 family)